MDFVVIFGVLEGRPRPLPYRSSY